MGVFMWASLYNQEFASGGLGKSLKSRARVPICSEVIPH